MDLSSLFTAILYLSHKLLSHFSDENIHPYLISHFYAASCLIYQSQPDTNNPAVVMIYLNFKIIVAAETMQKKIQNI